MSQSKSKIELGRKHLVLGNSNSNKLATNTNSQHFQFLQQQKK